MRSVEPPPPVPQPPHGRPDENACQAWTLAPLIAGRASMRVMNAATGKYDRAQRLTRHPPALPAAITVYDRTRRTRVLVLDFDAKHHTPATVAADLARVQQWVHDCGGRTVADLSTSGGAHLYVPLAHGESVTRRGLEPLLRLLAARCPTLDITPTLNDRTGCITPPGAACRTGGFRRLRGSLTDAVAAFTRRSRPALIAHLVAHLGGSITSPSSSAAASNDTDPNRAPELWDGTGDCARLRPHWRRDRPLPPRQLTFAETGALPADGRWPSRSHARQSLLATAALHGWSLTDVLSHLPESGGTWTGFADAYTKYGAHRDNQIRRDWNTACHWTSQHAPLFRAGGHKTQHTGGYGYTRAGRRLEHRWLAGALSWLDHQPLTPAHRATCEAVLQALAFAATHSGRHLNDVATVEFGIRSLSLAAGLMPRTTVAETLAHLREMPGSPILRVRPASGHHADRYALVTARHHGRPVRRAAADRVHVATIHDAWQIIGLRCRRVYELIVHTGLRVPAELFTAARVSPSSGYEILETLTVAGLITRARGHAEPGPHSLDDIAHAHGMPQRRTERISDYQRERGEWALWLALRDNAVDAPDHDPQPDITTPPAPPWDRWHDDPAAMWASILADDPPEQAPSPARTADDLALDLLIAELGATVIENVTTDARPR
ncbi:hypothetical protein ACWDUL_20310 [Nocardia niigatensis]